MTFSELQDEVYRILRDPQKTKYGLTSVKRRINHAEKLFCTAVKMQARVDTSITTVEDQNNYTLPSDYESEIAVFYDDDEIEEIDIALAHEEWMESMTPQYYYMLGDGDIYLVGDVPAGKELKIIYYSVGGAMSGDSDTPKVPEKYHMGLVFLAAFICARESDDTRADQFYQDFLKISGLAGVAEVDEAYGNDWPILGEQDDTGIYKPNDRDIYYG